MGAAETMYKKWKRDGGLSAGERIWKARQYARSVAMAPLWLRAADSTGAGVRCIGRPVIANLGTLRLGAGVVLRSRPLSVELATSRGGELLIGAGTSINSGSSIHADRLVQIGDRVRIAPYVHIMDTAFHEVGDRTARPEAKPVIIEDDVWICVKSTVLPGVRIGRGAVIGAHSLVTKDVPAGAVVMGAPARQVGTAPGHADGGFAPDDEWDRAGLDPSDFSSDDIHPQDFEPRGGGNGHLALVTVETPTEHHR